MFPEELVLFVKPRGSNVAALNARCKAHHVKESQLSHANLIVERALDMMNEAAALRESKHC